MPATSSQRFSGSTPPPACETWPSTPCRTGDHTVATGILFAADRLADRIPDGVTRRSISAGRALAREVDEVIGDGVMLHPPFPRTAPRHGMTIGRPWLLANAAVFNLLELPVTQVPLGLSTSGLPVGVQVAASRDDDHVTIAVALELERAFGGWVPPDAARERGTRTPA